MEPCEVARHMNEIARFVGPRDVAALDRASLSEEGLEGGVADVAVLFGGSIVAGGDVLAQAMRSGVARSYVISGGAGHTTETLREQMRRLHPEVEFADGASEAEVFDAYLRSRYGLRVDALETRSTNCGNNVTNLLSLLEGRAIAHGSMIVIQDATMQRRMEAGLRLRAPEVRVINYASYRVEVVASASEGRELLGYDHEPDGMWDVARYRALLMGEVPRLVDDERGYGPSGTGYIAHVDVPASVRASFEALRSAYPDSVREANPAFASQAGR